MTKSDHGASTPRFAKWERGHYVDFFLYDLSVANYLQGLDAVSSFLGKGYDFCKSNRRDPNEMIEVRLFADMLPFHSQIVFVVHHSLGAVEGLKNGVFTPPALNEAFDYPGLQKLVAGAASALQRLDREEVNALEGRDVIFQVGERKIPITAENCILSFSLPNFYFHAATAYDILADQVGAIGQASLSWPTAHQTLKRPGSTKERCRRRSA